MSGHGVEAVLIAGPTASGKSALALRLAQAFDGVVVNADSMQVYRDLRVLTARPSEAEVASAPHRLFGEVDGAQNFSVGHYARAVAPLLADIAGSGRLPIVAGGSGLYFRALTEGLSAIPPVPTDVRDRVRREAQDRPAADLHAELARADPASAATLKPGDRQRVLRALEIVAATGRSIVEFQGERSAGPLAGRNVVRVFLTPDRATLRVRIDARFRHMIDTGALVEIEALGRRTLDPALPVMRAHGVPALLAHLRGALTLEEAIARGQADTRAYAKRQFTWFRHQMHDFEPLAPEHALDVAAARIQSGGIGEGA